LAAVTKQVDRSTLRHTELGVGTLAGIDGTRFTINGHPTYEGRSLNNRQIEGLLFNSRMANAIFDDENPETSRRWRYPDTGVWDPERNTTEFCAALPSYARHGVLAVTVGLQGGGSIYDLDAYDAYRNSAFTRSGQLKPAYCARLERVLDAADDAGMVVIVNYFYWRQLQWLAGEAAIRCAAEVATDWLLATEHRNILVDVMNEVQAGDRLVDSNRVHELIELVKSRENGGRRLPTSTSVHPEEWWPPGKWPGVVDFFLPHGNNQDADALRAEIRSLRTREAYQSNARPILINEDSIHLDSLEAATDEYASWGYYSQGYGCGGSWKHGRFDWLARGRESEYEKLSGFQTVPVNWSINTAEKRAFFRAVAGITGYTV
jgi:hypothetical protein